MVIMEHLLQINADIEIPDNVNTNHNSSNNILIILMVFFNPHGHHWKITHFKSTRHYNPAVLPYDLTEKTESNPYNPYES